MPLYLRRPRKGKSPNWEIRGSYLDVVVERSAGTPKKSVAEQQLKRLEGQIERGEYPPKPLDTGAPTFLSAAVGYLKAGRRRKYVGPLIKHFRETPLAEIDKAAIDAAGAHVNLLITYQNKGRLPALSITPNIELYPWMTRNRWFEKTPEAEMAKWCGMWKDFPFPQEKTGAAVFPDQIFQLAEGESIARKFIDDAKDAVLPGTAILIEVVGCINYRFVGDANVHHSGFMRQIYKLDPGGNIYIHNRIPIDQGPIDPKQLGISDQGESNPD